MIVKIYTSSSTIILTAQMGGCETLMPKSSLWSEMPSLKNLLTAGRMIIKPFASPALGVFLLSIAKGQLVGWLVPQAQSKAREVPTSILTICHITWRRTDLAARHWHYLFTSQQCGFHVFHQVLAQQGLLGTGICWKSPNLNHFDIKQSKNFNINVRFLYDFTC